VDGPTSTNWPANDASRAKRGSVSIRRQRCSRPIATNSARWTPLFVQTRGLVTDIGGILAHGSIVVREYDIPAMMGTGIATQRIASGQLIALDGDAGSVTVVG
jgi:phosphohistidine swiveling domain-containing protein